MLDDQMSSELSANGSLGLADMIVAQLGAARSPEAHAAAGSEIRMRNEAFDTTLNLPYDEAKARNTAKSLGLDGNTAAHPVDFKTPQNFVESLKPYADRAAQSLGVDSSLLLAQAALETGWGKKWSTTVRAVATTYLILRPTEAGMANKVATTNTGIPTKIFQFKSVQRSVRIVPMKTASTTM